MGVILQTTPGEFKYKDIQQDITQHLLFWEAGKHSDLLSDTITENCKWFLCVVHVFDEK